MSKEIEDKARQLDGKEIRVKRLIIAVALASIGGTLICSPGHSLEEDIFAVILSAAVIFFAWWFAVIRNEKKYEKSRTDFNVNGIITQNGIFFNGGSEKGLDWNLLSKFKISDEMALLYGPKGSGLFFIFVKTYFSNDDWTKFTTLIKDKIG
jgi:hypothetical protein